MILANALKMRASVDPLSNFWYGPVGGESGSGISVTPESAMYHSAVFACVRLRAEIFGMIPLQMFNTNADNERNVAYRHPLYDVLHDRPNNWQTSVEWREMMEGHLSLRGNGYSEIIPGPRGVVDQLIPLHPDRVTPRQLENRSIIYDYHPPFGSRRTILQQDMFHVRGMTLDGVVGVNPIQYARETIGTAIAIERFGARLFKNQARFGGIFKTPGVLKPAAHDNLKRDLETKDSGVDNAGKTIILEDGLDWINVGMKAQDAEFLASRKYSVTDIARIFRIPPHMIADLERATFSNIEEQSIEFVVYCFGPTLKRWEQRIKNDLILSPNYFAEFNIDGLLRGNIAARFTAFGMAIRDGWMTRNEVRRLQNMNPIPGLDRPLQPLNMTDGTQPVPAKPQPSGLTGRTMRFIMSASEHLAKKEQVAVRKALAKHQGDALAQWADEFYAGWSVDLAKALKIPFKTAEAFALGEKTVLLQANGNIGVLLDEWEISRSDQLMELASGSEAQIVQ